MNVYCDRKNCFAYDAHYGTCRALNNNDFGGDPCHFFKTRDQQARDLAAAEKRSGIPAGKYKDYLDGTFTKCVK